MKLDTLSLIALFSAFSAVSARPTAAEELQAALSGLSQAGQRSPTTTPLPLRDPTAPRLLGPHGRQEPSGPRPFRRIELTTAGPLTWGGALPAKGSAEFAALSATDRDIVRKRLAQRERVDVKRQKRQAALASNDAGDDPDMAARKAVKSELMRYGRNEKVPQRGSDEWNALLPGTKATLGARIRGRRRNERRLGGVESTGASTARREEPGPSSTASSPPHTANEGRDDYRRPPASYVAIKMAGGDASSSNARRTAWGGPLPARGSAEYATLSTYEKRLIDHRLYSREQTDKKKRAKVAEALSDPTAAKKLKVMEELARYPRAGPIPVPNSAEWNALEAETRKKLSRRISTRRRREAAAMQGVEEAGAHLDGLSEAHPASPTSASHPSRAALQHRPPQTVGHPSEAPPPSPQQERTLFRPVAQRASLEAARPTLYRPAASRLAPGDTTSTLRELQGGSSGAGRAPPRLHFGTSAFHPVPHGAPQP